MENEEVLFHWSMIAVDIDEEHTNELPQEIVMLWVTIRGFAVAASWLEHYKEEARTQPLKRVVDFVRNLVRGNQTMKVFELLTLYIVLLYSHKTYIIVYYESFLWWNLSFRPI